MQLNVDLSRTRDEFFLGRAHQLRDLLFISDILVGDALFGPGHGRTFMLIEAFTVFLALIGTTLSCINTGARVTYAMGKDNEVPEHFGMLHSKNLTPHKAIWTLVVISIVVAIIGLSVWAGDAGAPQDAAIQALPHGFLSSFGYTTHDGMAKLPNTLLTVTLSSNFGTFLLYGLSCGVCMVGYHKHPKFSMMRHFLIPLFGVVANLACLVTPRLLVSGVTCRRHLGRAAVRKRRSPPKPASRRRLAHRT